MPNKNLLGTMEYNGSDVERLVRTCNNLNATINALAKVIVEEKRDISANDLMNAVISNNVQLALTNPGQDWYNFTALEIKIKLAKAEITEGLAAALLDTHIVSVRQQMIDAFGWGWRDLEELSAAALEWLFRANLAPTQYDETISNEDIATELIASGVVVHVQDDRYRIFKGYRREGAPAYQSQDTE